MSTPKPSSIRVLSWRGAWGRALEQAVSAPFRAATGIRVEPVHHVGRKLPADLTSALECGSAPPLDVVWCNASPALRAAERGLCEPLTGLPERTQLRRNSRIEPLLGSTHVARNAIA